MKKIPLTTDKFALVDSVDYNRLSQFKWHLHSVRDSYYYAVRYICQKGKTQAVLMHREILNPPDYMQIDHRNRDGLDNRKTNLRVCTHAENMQNRSLAKNNKSGFKGVYLEKHAKKWRARIGVNKKEISLGSFDTPTEASMAYIIASIKYHGDFARA